MARKQLGSAVLFGNSASSEPGGLEYDCPRGQEPGRLARCVGAPVSWPSVPDGKKSWALCMLAVSLSSSRSARPSLCLPTSAKTSGLQNEYLEELATHSICQGERQTWAGEGAWMAFIRSGLPRARPSCLEKPRAAPCGKWLFGSAAELLNVLDRLVSPQSLATRTRQLLSRETSGSSGQDSQPHSLRD